MVRSKQFGPAQALPQNRLQLPRASRTEKPVACPTASRPSLEANGLRPEGAGPRKRTKKSGVVKPEKSTALPTDAARKTGDEFGLEGTNKTVATPKPDNAPPDELGLGPHVEKTPYTRG